jgi:hypothetical protein
MAGNATSWGLGLLGAVAGGVLGYFAFGWLYQQGFYAMMLPGGLIGIGCGILSRHDSTARGALCGIAALAMGLFTEFSYRYVDEDTFLDFLKHFSERPKLAPIMILLGAGLSFWFARGQYQTRRPPSPPPKPTPTELPPTEPPAQV